MKCLLPKYVIAVLFSTGKKRKARSDLAEVCLCLRDLDKAAEERAEEREFKRKKLEWEIEQQRQAAEEKRREVERKHEERMNYIFIMLARQMMGQPQDAFYLSGFGSAFPPPGFGDGSED